MSGLQQPLLNVTLRLPPLAGPLGKSRLVPRTDAQRRLRPFATVAAVWVGRTLRLYN